MRETLVDQLKTIEIIPYYIDVDKYKETRELLEAWRKHNNLVDKAILGECSIIDEYKSFSKYRGGKNFVPHYINPEEQKRIKELELIIGSVGLSNGENLVINPISIGSVGTLLIGGEIYLLGRSRSISRREFLKMLLVAAGAGTFLMTTIGTVASLSKLSLQDEAAKSANYVQVTIEAVYKPGLNG